MFCTKCCTGFMPSPFSCSARNVTRVYARVMFCIKCHLCLFHFHVLCKTSPVFMPVSYSVPNVTRVYARDMFCGIKYHTCLCHWLCHIMCKMPHLIMRLTVSCFVQNSTRDYAIGCVMFCVKCHECLCHWPCHVMCKISRVVMPVSCSRRNVTRVYPREYILRKMVHLFMPLPTPRSAQNVTGVYLTRETCSGRNATGVY